MMSTSLGRAVASRHSIAVGSLHTKVMKVVSLPATRAVLLLRAAGSTLPVPSARAFSSSPVFFVATKKKATATRKVSSSRGRTAAKKKPAAKRTAAKKKPAAKKKKAAPKKKKKAVATKRTRRLTPEQRLARREKLLKAKRIARVRDLRVKALLKEEPRSGASTPWLVFSTLNRAELVEQGVHHTKIFGKLSEQFKSLSDPELEKLKTVAKANHDTYLAKYAAWIKRHTPLEISTANKARSSLKRLKLKTRHPLHDARLPKKHSSAWLFYATEKIRSRPEGAPITPVLKEAGAEWRGLTAAEKKPYEDMSEQDKKRYAQQSKHAFGF